MTTYEAASLLVQIVTACGIVAALLQLRDTRKWNKMSMAISYLPQPQELNKLEQYLNDSFLRIIDRSAPLSQEELATLLTKENNQLRIALKNYLNMLEAYCAAVNYQIIDPAVAKAIYDHKFERHFAEMKPYIEYCRGAGSMGFMDEMEESLRVWRGEKPRRKTY